MISPICLFLYNRPVHTEKVLESLILNAQCCESELFVFIDGPESEMQNKLKSLVLDYSQKFKQVTIETSGENQGLARSVSSGVTKVTQKFGKVIVLEDDIVVAPYFLEYMNTGLELYKSSKTVFSINAYMHPIHFNTNETFLSPLATSSWGWGTWSDRWDKFTLQIDKGDVSRIQKNKELRSQFNLGDLDYAKMLDNKKSWAIKWYYCAFKNNALGLFPTQTLVENIGFDGSGVHTKNEISSRIDTNAVMPQFFKQNEADWKKHKILENHFKKKGILAKLKSKIC